MPKTPLREPRVAAFWFPPVALAVRALLTGAGARANIGHTLREVSMLRSRLKATAAGAVCALAAGLGFAAVAQPSETDRIPDFAPDSGTGWVLDRSNHDDLLPVGSEPGPVTFDKANPYIPNGSKEQPTYRVADLESFMPSVVNCFCSFVFVSLIQRL